MNPDVERLHPYPFERLAALKAGVTPPAGLEHISLSIGEPRHPPPGFVVEALRAACDDLGSYPVVLGGAPLREAAVRWLQRRYGLPEGYVDPVTQVLPVNGTREGIFSLVQAVVERRDKPAVLMPNPFYQIYEGAALLAGAEPVYLATRRENGYLPDLEAVDAGTWDRCQLLFLCSPGNPTGAVMGAAYLERALELADRHDFIVAADECYAEIYSHEDQPPPGLLEICRARGRDDLSRAIVLHSLSKRSNVPGLRSGFVAGDARVMDVYRRYRTYHGCAMPEPTQRASVGAWDDDAHVVANRAAYREKFHRARDILADTLEVELPAGAFYLWMRTPIDEERFAQQLFAGQNLTVLPGSYLSRPDPDGDPGEGHVRISLVPDVSECETAMHRLREFLRGL